jgi:hypothetical protein
MELAWGDYKLGFLQMCSLIISGLDYMRPNGLVEFPSC